MPNDQSPSDDVLRLILAADHEEWLRAQINASRIFIWAMTVFLLVGVIWGTVNFKSTLTYFDEPKCYVLLGPAANNEQLLEQFKAQGIKPCSPPGSAEALKAKEIGLLDILAYSTFLAWLVVLVSALTLVRHLYLQRKFTKYLEDHRAFLKKYNRLE